MKISTHHHTSSLKIRLLLILSYLRLNKVPLLLDVLKKFGFTYMYLNFVHRDDYNTYKDNI
jgi:hypothetical protein